MAATKPAIYALLIGINEYDPASEVSSLDGCVNDVKAMEKFLKTHYKDSIPARGIKKLFNEKATRENVIKAFQSQLIKKAKPGDTVLLYYAGHGSFNESSAVFKKFDGKEQDETFVCYDSRLEGHYDLADKEIAALLSRIDKEVDIVVIADSCHSASVTRSLKPPKKKRFFKGRSGERALNSYLLAKDDFYGKMLKTTGRITIPNSRHLLMSGCDRGEESLETFDQRGLFTTTLLKQLTANPNISYSHLFEAVRDEVLRKSDNEQQPTLNAWESFNPNTVFLKKGTQPNTRHLITFKEDKEKWEMAYGAIYGLPSNPTKAENITIGIYEGQEPGADFVEQVKVEKVNLGTTVLATPSKLEERKKYWGEIQNFPSALNVYLQGTKKDIAAFNELYEQAPSVFVRLKTTAKKAKYILNVTADNTTLSLMESGKVVKEVNDLTEESVTLIKEGLDHVAKWETTAALENEQEEVGVKNDLEFAFQVENEERKWEALKNNTVTLNYGDGNPDNDPQPIWYQVKARNVSQKPLFVALLHLSADFEIKAYFQSQILEGESEWKILDTDHALIIDKPEDAQSTDIFKILISNKRFDEQKFLLPKLERSRKVISRADHIKNLSLKEQEHWFAHTITINLVRHENKISKKVSTLNDKITVKGHKTFTADLSFGAATKDTTRSVTPWSQLQRKLANDGVELLHLEGEKKSRSVQSSNVIELSNLQNEKDLKANPLELNVKQDLADSETVIPVTFDGEFIIPVGTSVKLEDGSVDLKIDNLPTYEDKGREKKRSLTRAAWFSLLKLARFDDHAYFKLRKVYYRKGEAKRTRLKKSHLRGKNKILLVVHGIIGDTKGMIKHLEFLLDSKKYDLILTFDYENLNTEIEDIADALNERLGEFGLGVDDGKSLDILAHSMGGLVSRYMIEYVREGDNLVDNLFMFGTPNGGSVFGDIPAFRDKMTALLTIGLNYGKPWLGQIGVVVGFINKGLMLTSTVTKTLAQMSPDSEFIGKLVNSKVKGHTKYTVVAGDINKYHSLNDAFFSKLMDKVLLKVGNVANKDPNDVAVMVEWIRAVPDEIGAMKYDVCCHHMNYFEEGDGLDILKEIMG